MPNIFNDPASTPQMKSQLLWDIKNSQSPGVQHVVNALRSPKGLPVSNLNWTPWSQTFCLFRLLLFVRTLPTSLAHLVTTLTNRSVQEQMDDRNDNNLLQANSYSGPKGHGHCWQYTNITCPRGYLWGVAPGTKYFSNVLPSIWQHIYDTVPTAVQDETNWHYCTGLLWWKDSPTTEHSIFDNLTFDIQYFYIQTFYTQRCEWHCATSTMSGWGRTQAST